MLEKNQARIREAESASDSEPAGCGSAAYSVPAALTANSEMTVKSKRHARREQIFIKAAESLGPMDYLKAATLLPFPFTWNDSRRDDARFFSLGWQNT